MDELLSAGLWPRLRQLAKKAQRKHAAVAYVTDDRFVTFDKGDLLVTDASDGAIKSGQTSAAVLKAALKREAQIVSITGLHAKLYVFDRCAIVGSANLSKESEMRTEVALLTDQPSTVSASRLLIESLKGDGEIVDDSFIARIGKLPVTKMAPMAADRKRLRKVDLLPRTWLVGLKPIEVKADEQESVEEGQAEAQQHVSDESSEVSWIRSRGNSRFRREAKEGDLVISIWTENGNGKPHAVYHHAPILLRQDDPVNDSVRFWVEEYPDSEETTLTWKQFHKLFSQIGLPGKLTQWPTRELASNHSAALHDLWFD
jgi:hypothetical protein